MDKQEVLKKFNKQLIIENYSEQTIRNYTSALKLFLVYIKNLKRHKFIRTFLRIQLIK